MEGEDYHPEFVAGEGMIDNESNTVRFYPKEQGKTGNFSFYLKAIARGNNFIWTEEKFFIVTCATDAGYI